MSAADNGCLNRELEPRRSGKQTTMDRRPGVASRAEALPSFNALLLEANRAQMNARRVRADSAALRQNHRRLTNEIIRRRAAFLVSLTPIRRHTYRSAWSTLDWDAAPPAELAQARVLELVR